MSLPEPVRAFCYAASELVPGTRRTPWGLVTTDPRFPMIWDANNAAVLEPNPGLRLEEIEDVLVPALRAAGAGHHHVEVWETSVGNPALRTMRRRGSRTRLFRNAGRQLYLVRLRAQFNRDAGPRDRR